MKFPDFSLIFSKKVDFPWLSLIWKRDFAIPWFLKSYKITNKYYNEFPWFFSLIQNEIPWFFPDFLQKGRFSLTWKRDFEIPWFSLIFPDAGHPAKDKQFQYSNLQWV